MSEIDFVFTGRMTPSQPTQMDATPTPWRRGSDELNSPELFSEIYAPNGYRIAVCQTAHTRGKDQRDSVDAARANAALIVRAVNSHAALLASHQRLAEALICAKNVLYLLTPEVSALGMRAYLIHGKIDAALASIPPEIQS